MVHFQPVGSFPVQSGSWGLDHEDSSQSNLPQQIPSPPRAKALDREIDDETPFSLDNSTTVPEPKLSLSEDSCHFNNQNTQPERIAAATKQWFKEHKVYDCSREMKAHLVSRSKKPLYFHGLERKRKREKQESPDRYIEVRNSSQRHVPPSPLITSS